MQSSHVDIVHEIGEYHAQVQYELLRFSMTGDVKRGDIIMYTVVYFKAEKACTGDKHPRQAIAQATENPCLSVAVYGQHACFIINITLCSRHFFGSS